MAEGMVPAPAGAGGGKVAGGVASQQGASSPPARKDDLDSTVVYTARDSLIYNFDNRTADLYGKAKVDYKDMRLTGPRITVDHIARTVHSIASRDAKGRADDLPVYKDRSGSFMAETMTYNYQTRKGLTMEVSSRDPQQGIYSGHQAKRLPTGEIYVLDGVYTTCDEDPPHYWFAGRKMKIIPDDRIVARPVVMWLKPEIFHRRLPAFPLLPLPFMSMPISTKRASGFLFPSFGSDSNRGAYFSNLGYYWAINDYADLRAATDISFNGSYRAEERFRYNVLNRFSGSIESQYESYNLKHPDDPAHVEYKNWYARFIHHQQFDPTAKLDLNLQYIGGDRYYDVNSINPEVIITQQATSYASFSKSWDDGNRVFAVGYRRVSSLTSENVAENLSGSLYQSRIYPFRAYDETDQKLWSSRFSIDPTLSFSGQFTNVLGTHTDLYTANAGMNFNFQQDFAPGYRATFTQGVNFQQLYQTQTLQNSLSGNYIQLPFTVQSTLFKYLTLTPSFTFTRYHVNSTILKYYDGGEKTVVVNQPGEYSTAVFSISAQSRLYGAMNTGFLEDFFGLKAIRHTFIPTVTFTYNPDYQGASYNYYGTYYNPVSQSIIRYNRFDSSLYSAVPQSERYVGISIQNLIHGKFRNPNPSADPDKPDKTVQLLSFTAATGYNFAADSLRIAPLTLSASSNALSPSFQMTWGATYDFYTYDPTTGARINKLNSEVGRGLLRMLTNYINMSFSVNGNLRESFDATSESSKSGPQNGAPKVEQAIFRDRYSNGELVEFSPLLPWSLRASLYLVNDQSNPVSPSKSVLLNTSGRIALSRNWQAGVTTGFDMVNREFIYPQISVYRDLHDFQFRFQWVPSGQYRSYQIEFAMKPPQLKDLRYKASSAY